MSDILADLPGVVHQMDDIFGKTQNEHDQQHLESVLGCTEEANVMLSPQKCEFSSPQKCEFSKTKLIHFLAISLMWVA